MNRRERRKLHAIKEMGIDPYGGRYEGAEPAAETKARYKDGEEEPERRNVRAG